MTAGAQVEATRRVFQRMEAALAKNADDRSEPFQREVRWIGDRACGIAPGHRVCQKNRQRPLRAAFTERARRTNRFHRKSERTAGPCDIEAVHGGASTGIGSRGKRVTIPCMGFPKVSGGRGDIRDSHGRDHFHDGTRVPPRPDEGDAR